MRFLPSLVSTGSPELTAAMLAVTFAGCLVTMLDPALPPSDLVRLIEAADPRLLMLSRACAARLREKLRAPFFVCSKARNFSPRNPTIGRA